MISEGRPFKGKELERLKAFLTRMDLEYDEGIEYTVCILDEAYEIIGTGSVEYNVIKCVAIDPDHQGEGHSATILSALIQYQFEQGRTHMFIYTKPKNLPMFGDMGFYTIFQTPEVLFMENRAGGFDRFLAGLKRETPQDALQEGRRIGAIVANCNPFTLGHRYLIEQALERCDYIHVFVLSDNRSFFSADDRYQMVKLGTEGLDRVILHRTSDYMISAATFPTYFFKDQMQGQRANCRLDLELFGSRIAPELGITRRFVGTEPFCQVTEAYNGEMKRILPEYGIEVVEIPRQEKDGEPVSASQVRACLEKGETERLKGLVPPSVLACLMKKKEAI